MAVDVNFCLRGIYIFICVNFQTGEAGKREGKLSNQVILVNSIETKTLRLSPEVDTALKASDLIETHSNVSFKNPSKTIVSEWCACN